MKSGIGERNVLVSEESCLSSRARKSIRFMNVEYDLTTGCGEVTFVDNTIALTTRNSVYEFEILGGDKECREDC